jgi:MarR family transcriptional regulator, organic hydroperoxide resistance regulator
MSNSSFGFAKPEDSPGFLLWQTTISWQRLIKKALEPYKISHAQFIIMALVLWFEEHNEDATQIVIANWTKLDKMTVSKALKNLVGAGLVTREEHILDTRAKKVILTKQGKQLVQKLVPVVEQIDAEFFGRVDVSQQQSLVQVLSALYALS